MAVLQNPIHLLSQIRKKFPEAEKEDWILRLDDTKRKPKRSCVVCVARRPSLSESSLPLDETKSSLISFTLNPSHRITNAHFRDSICGLNATDVIGRRIDQLCVRDDKSVLDTLLDSVAECSAELRLCIKENIISTRARTLKSANNNSDGSIVLECAVIRCLKHCLQKQFSAPGGCSSDNNGTNNNAKLKMSSSSESLKSCAIEDTALDKRRHSTPSETLSPETPFDVPRCGIDAISPATATESSASVHFETLSPPSSIPTELKCSEPSSTNSDALSQLCTTIFAEVPTTPTDSVCDYTTNTVANSNSNITSNSNNSVSNRNNKNNNSTSNNPNNPSPLQPPCHQPSSSSPAASQQLLIHPPPPPHPQTQTPPFQFYSDQMFYVPCSSSLPPPQTAITSCVPAAPHPPPQYLASAEVAPPPPQPPTVELTKNGKVKKPRRPRQPKPNSRGRGGNQKRKNSAPEPSSMISTVSNVQQWCPQMNATAPPQTQNAMQPQCPTNGPPKVKDALLKSLLQSAHTSEQTPTRCSSSSSLCSPIPDPAPIMRSSSDNTQPSFAYPDHLSWSTSITDESQNECLPCIASTSAAPLPQSAMYHQATMAQSQPILTGTFVPSGMPSSGSVPQLSNNVYGTQMSTCCSYPSSATGGCGGIVTGDCAPYEMIPSMIASSNAPMLAMNGSMQDAHQRSAAMMQRQQHWSSTQDFIYQQPSQTAVFQQAMVSSNALPSPSMKTSSPLKRKPVSAMSQSNVNIPTTNPSTTNELPPKFVHVNQQSAHQQQYPTLYQLSSSANSSNQSASPQQYPQQQQQQSAVSPQQYPTQSPNAVSRLSPYGGYDASQNGTCSLNTSVGGTGSMGPPPTQWSKRGAGAEMIRMDIRQHSVPGALPNYSSPMMPSSTTPPQLQSTPPSNQLLQQHNASLSNTGNATSNGNQPIIVIQSQTLEQVPNQLSNGYYVTSSSPLTTNLSPQNYYSTGMPTAINDPMNSANALTQQTSMIPTELYDFNLGNGGFDMDNDATRMLVQKLLS